RAVTWALRILTAKLMFLSGYVKLASGDPTWRSLSALHYHFMTQPLPTPIGWYLHQLPDALLSCMAAVMFVIELGAPVLVFFGPLARRAAFLSLVLLQLLILLSGNYGFFNVLTITLCLPLIEDRDLPAFSRLIGLNSPSQTKPRYFAEISGIFCAVCSIA